MPNSDKHDTPKSSAKRGRLGITIFAVLGWTVASLLIAEKIHAENLNGALHGALVRSQTERQALSQELERMSQEMDVLENRLSLYRSRDSQAAVAP